MFIITIKIYLKNNVSIALKELKDATDANNFYAVIFNFANNFVYTGAAVYSDDQCQNSIPGVKYKDSSTSDGKIFVETDVTLYKDGVSGIFTSDELFIGLTDIDASQSYKIINSNNLMSKNNMYTADASALQPTNTSEGMNMFVPSGNYIYSSGHFDTVNNSNIFVKIAPETQRQGLD